MPLYTTRVTCGLGRGDVHFEWYEGPAPGATPMAHAETMHAFLRRLHVEGAAPQGWPKTDAEWAACRLVRVQVYPAGRTGGLPLAERDF